MIPPIYLDYNATTPVALEVADAIQPFLDMHFGNPSSSHAYGLTARQAVAEARASVAELIHAKQSEIVFTGSATEANNLALLGVAAASAQNRRHLVVSAIEHPAVMQPAQHLREMGWELTVVPVDSYGRVDPRTVAAAVRPDTALVSIMHANNEVGTIQPITEIAHLIKPMGVLFHTDAAQSAGKIEIDVDVLGVDLLTLAGHKFYATKGVGALYVRSGTPIKPIMFGAEQEHGLRPGTENVPLIVGLGEAARLARKSLPVAEQKMQMLRDTLHERLAAAVPGLVLNGHPVERLPNTLHVSFPGISGRDLLSRVRPTGCFSGIGLPFRGRCSEWRAGRDGMRCGSSARSCQILGGKHDHARRNRNCGDGDTQRGRDNQRSPCFITSKQLNSKTSNRNSKQPKTNHGDDHTDKKRPPEACPWQK